MCAHKTRTLMCKCRLHVCHISTELIFVLNYHFFIYTFIILTIYGIFDMYVKKIHVKKHFHVQANILNVVKLGFESITRKSAFRLFSLIILALRNVRRLSRELSLNWYVRSERDGCQWVSTSERRTGHTGRPDFSPTKQLPKVAAFQHRTRSFSPLFVACNEMLLRGWLERWVAVVLVAIKG